MPTLWPVEVLIEMVRKHIRKSSVALLAGVILLWSAAAAAFNEYQVKAAFWFHFAQFVTWQSASFASETSPIVLGIFGRDPFDGLLDQIFKGEVVRCRPVVIRRLESVEAGRDCHILFVSASERSRMLRVLDALKDSSVLTVGERDGFCLSGGMVNFVAQRDRIGIEINPRAVEKAGLRIHSRLLKLAKLVVEKN